MASGLTDETIVAAQLFSATAAEVLDILGFNPTQSPGLAFPYPGTSKDRERPFIRIKPDIPPTIQGKKAKYLSPKGSTNRLYIPPSAKAAVDDVSIPLYLTEGEKKALKGSQEGLACVALAGVWCWKCRSTEYTSEPISDFETIRWAGRIAYIVFDSDAIQKQGVRHAERALANELMSRGATVRIIRLPTFGTDKMGLDDFLVHHTVQELLQLPPDTPLRDKGKPNPSVVLKGLKDQHLEIKELVTEIRKHSTLKAFERKRALSQVILSDLQQQGVLYRTRDHTLYLFSQHTKRLYQVDGLEFARFVADRYGINRSEEEFRYVLEEVLTEAYTRGTLTDVRQFAYYDPRSRLLYVSNHKNQMYRLDGHTIMLIDNGSDGVLFPEDPLADPFTYLQQQMAEGSLDQLILDRVNFVTSPHALLTREECDFLLLLYLLALPFESLHPTKPVLLLTGPKGSGKTYLLKAIGRFLFGRHFNVTTLSKDKEDAFVAAICARSWVAYDNVDSRIAWLNDRLATASTGQRIELRKLYTTNDQVVYFPRAHIALTARTPQFKRDDVVDRLLIFPLHRLSRFLSEGALLAEISAHRDALWTEYLNDLNRIVAGLREHETAANTTHRLADFATFALSVGRVLQREDEVSAILDKLRKHQSDFLLEDEPIAGALRGWLQDPANYDRPVTSGELFTALGQAALASGLPFPFQSAIGFGQRMKNLLSNLEEALEVRISVDKGKANKTVYTFSRKTFSP
jgi:hypothetical protein